MWCVVIKLCTAVVTYFLYNSICKSIEYRLPYWAIVRKFCRTSPRFHSLLLCRNCNLRHLARAIVAKRQVCQFGESKSVQSVQPPIDRDTCLVCDSSSSGSAQLRVRQSINKSACCNDLPCSSHYEYSADIILYKCKAEAIQCNT